MEEILKKVLKKITPTQKGQKEIKIVYEMIISAVNSVIKPKGLSFILAGSYYRDTWLPNKKEFDVFILFPESASREELEKQGLNIGKKIMKKLNGKHVIAYAEHPYVRGTFKGYDLDIVPAYKVKDASKIKSAVDRTPFHNRFVEKNLPKNLAGEVRLLKQFSKGIGIYGSDTKTQGFSGYLCELMIIHFKSFSRFVKSAAEWEPGEVFIDINKHHTKPEEVKLRKRYKGQSLIVIDPVDPDRNVAAALSPENFLKLVTSSREFLRKPSEHFFFRKTERFSKTKLKSMIKDRETKLLLLEFKRPEVIDDVLWPQLRKASNRIKNELNDQEFKVMGIRVYSSESLKKCLILIEMEVWELPNVRVLVGPEVFAKKRTKQFIKKYRSKGRIWIEKDKYHAEIKRKDTKVGAGLRRFLTGSGKDLKERGIPSYIAKSIAKSYVLLDSDDRIVSKLTNNEISLFLWSYLNKNLLV